MKKLSNLCFLHNVFTGFTFVSIGWFMIVSVRFTENQLMFTPSEGVSKDRYRVQIRITVASFCLPCRWPIKVPYGQLVDRLGIPVNSSGFRSHSLTWSINPYIVKLDKTSCIQIHVSVQYSLVETLVHLHGWLR